MRAYSLLVLARVDCCRRHGHATDAVPFTLRRAFGVLSWRARDVCVVVASLVIRKTRDETSQLLLSLGKMF